MRSKSILFAAGTALCLLLGELPSATAAEPSTADKRAAKDLIVAGDRAFSSRDYAQALEHYRKAYDHVRVPTVGVELIKAHVALGQLIEARERALEVQQLPLKPGESPMFQAARHQAAGLAVELGARIASVELDVTPAGVPFAVTIDGTRLAHERLGSPIPFNPGPHRIDIGAPGHQGVTQNVVLAEAEHQKLNATLTPLASAPALSPEMATAAANAPDGAPGPSSAPVDTSLPPTAPASDESGEGVAALVVLGGMATAAGLISALSSKPVGTGLGFGGGVFLLSCAAYYASNPTPSPAPSTAAVPWMLRVSGSF